VHLVSANKDKTSVFKVKSVNVKVDSLKFSIRDSKHDFLYKTLKPLATGLVKKQIQKAIQDGVRTGLEYLDGQLVGVRDRMDAAKATQGQDGIESKSRMQVLQEVPSFHLSKYGHSLTTFIDVPEEEGRDCLPCEREVSP
jgi:hypothetical protein